VTAPLYADREELRRELQRWKEKPEAIETPAKE
jgi:hypothetical protein